MALRFLCPGAPNDQLAVGDLHAAKSAIFVGVLNGIIATTSLCLSDGGRGGAEDVEQRRRYCIYQFANYLTAMLGVALLAVDMAFDLLDGDQLGSSPVWEPVLKWMIWITKVLTGGTLQFGLSVLHSCLRLMLIFA